MSQLLLNMAKQAVNDPSLMAALINKYSQRTGTSWAEIPLKLQITPTQLSKLALCRQPNGNPHQEIQQIADYVNMSSVVLNRFYEEAVNPKTNGQSQPGYRPKSVEQKPQQNSFTDIFRSGNTSMSRKYLWATSFVLLLILAISAFVVAQPTAVSEATLVVNAGEATITRAGTDKSYTAVSGEAVVVTAGDTVTTDTTATAQLHLADGGTVDIFEDSAVEITELVTTEETYQVTLTMLTGRTLNRVVHLLGIDDHYEVRSPSSTASVRGTVFTVDVLSQISTHVVVDEGVVHVAMGDQSVDVKAGFEVTAVVGELLMVNPQHQEAPPAPEPTATTPPTPTEEVVVTPEPTEPAETPEAVEASSKGSDKEQEAMTAGMPLLPTPTIGTKINPDGTENPDEGDSPSNPGAGQTDDPKDKTDGGNPHDGMVVPGSPPTDSSGSPPAGGAEPPGQDGTPPGQTSNPGSSDSDNNSGGNSGNSGNSGGNSGNSGNSGGKKDK